MPPKPIREMKELARVTQLQIEEHPFYSIEAYVIGKNVICNPNAIRIDDLKTGDVVFYELEEQLKCLRSNNEHTANNI